jgi:tyrosinase
MMDTIVEIFNGVLLNNSVCDDGQPNGGSAAACTAYLLNLVGITQVAPGPQPAPGVRVRKEVHAMTVEERTLYIETYRQAYDDVDSGLQELIDRETMFFSRGLHNNGAFLPWHRGYLLEVENILREFNPHVTVPYWNWSLQPRISEDSIWGDGPDQFSGNGDSNRCVMDGTFGWNSGFRLTNGNCLQRRLSGGSAASTANVDVLINRYPQPWQYDSFRNRLEHGPGLHDSVHCLVGGTMCSIRSANDPVFVLHHANIDRIWARWQAQSEEHRAAYSGSTAVDNFMPASPYTPGELLDLRFQPSGVAGEFIEIRYEAEETGYSQ